MRVIGTSKRWWGQKGTQPHPENLIGESLEAQHSKGESLLNYIYIHTCIHKPSVILALLASSLYFESCSSSLETATETSSIQTSLYSPTPTFSHHLTFFPPSISSFWPLSASRFNIFMVQFYFKLHKLFFFLFTFFEPSDTNPPRASGFHLWKHLLGSLSSNYSIVHLTNIFRVIAHSDY